ncbi:membrane protein implicated in regulation of membrane protease activity [Natranaerovirga pectinivora]|uniref:Membrane protein implicated in regulation of membrane protease activity n=1 Tax=Natranaerovirga pectinivora TaxID=682400 RepID=A0A4R3MJU1_9FIRM|nr:NfeD family protein [Natranaerovirga pectinivora]TCT14689.1 membrane protein implicated in regulation of membrane protease activity [Natranaerovirga pectinivora]
MIDMLWLIILVLSLLIEALTLGLATIWFAFGALAAWVLSLFGIHMAVQVTVFFVISFVMLYYTRPVAIKVLKIGKTKTNYESIIGKEGVVTEEINNLKGVGVVKVDGNTWTARGKTNEIIERDSVIKVAEVIGVKLIVEKIQ